MGCDTQLVGDELEYASCNTRELPPELTSAITSGPANKSEWTAKPPNPDASPPDPSRLFGVVPRCSALLAGAEPERGGHALLPRAAPGDAPRFDFEHSRSILGTVVEPKRLSHKHESFGARSIGLYQQRPPNGTESEDQPSAGFLDYRREVVCGHAGRAMPA